MQPDGSSGTFDAGQLEIVRNEGANQTIYELAIPWSALRTAPDDQFVSPSAAIIDYDGDTESGIVEWAGGIVGGKNPATFNRGRLV